MIAIVSPAKTLDFQSAVPFSIESQPQFLSESDYLAKKLSKLSKAKLNELMKVSDALLDENYSRYQQWDSSDSTRTKQAVFAFKGEVYRGLEADSLSKEDIEYAQDHLRILSGIYGVLQPMDKIQPYRLEMGSRFQITSKQKNLYQYWGSKIGDALTEELNEQKQPTLLNLASKEYSKSLELKTFKPRVIDITFKENKDGVYKVIGTFSKLARGKFARFFIQNRCESLEELIRFESDGYQYQESLSSEKELVFTR